jgi:HEAT repeat protein
MKSLVIRHTSVLAAIAILLAVAATRRSSEETAVRSVRPAPTTMAAASVPPVLEPERPTEHRIRPVQKSRPELGLALPDRQDRLALLRDLLKGSDASVKSRALTALRGLRGADAAALAIGVLQGNGPSWLRAQAASVLGEIADPSAYPALLEASRADDLDLRACAASSLDRLGNSAPLQELIGALTLMLDDRDAGKREDAVFVLSSLQTSTTIPPLAKAIRDSTNSRVREAAADALGRSTFAEAVSVLETALDDPQPRVREAAREAIDAIKARKRP